METGSLKQKTVSENGRTYHLALIIALAAGFILSVWFVSLNFCRSHGTVNINLESRVNPNYATAASLARLPGIGISLADRIVKYRESFASKNRTHLVFEKPEDLKNVSGIGPKKTENIRELLKFN